MQYVTSDEFLNSPYGRDYAPPDSIFATSGEVDEFLTYVSSLVDMYCGRTFVTGAYEEIHDNVYQRYLFLRNFPIHQVNIVRECTIGSNPVTSQITDFTVFKKTGKLKFLISLNRSAYYEVEYIAGPAEVPNEIKLATMMWANILAQAVDNGAVAHVDGGQNTQFRFNKFWESYSDPRNKNTSSLVPPAVDLILRRYKYFK